MASTSSSRPRMASRPRAATTCSRSTWRWTRCPGTRWPAGGAGMHVESSKGEAWPGQQETTFHFADALKMADNHVIYKNGIKEMAHQHGCSVTFMAKPDHTWIGSSCHVPSSLWKGGRNTFDGESETFRQYPPGHIAGASELAIFLAPNINSSTRHAAGTE